jgi:hypothetical protein
MLEDYYDLMIPKLFSSNHFNYTKLSYTASLDNRSNQSQQQIIYYTRRILKEIHVTKEKWVSQPNNRLPR